MNGRKQPLARPGSTALTTLLLGWNTLSASPPTVEELFREPTVRDAALSPDGKHVVLLYRTAVTLPHFLDGSALEIRC